MYRDNYDNEQCWVVRGADGMLYAVTDNEMDAGDFVISGPHTTLPLARKWAASEHPESKSRFAWLTDRLPENSIALF